MIYCEICLSTEDVDCTLPLKITYTQVVAFALWLHKLMLKSRANVSPLIMCTKASFEPPSYVQTNMSYIRWIKKNVPTLVVFKNTRYTINARCPSMVVKRNSLAFYPYPTFVIPTTSMDTIPKTMTVVALK